MNNIKKLFVISRPVSWPNTAYPFAAAYIMSGNGLDVTFWVATLYFLIPYNLLMYGINDVFDYESDIKNPRKGGIEGAVEQKAFHPTILWAAAITNLPFLVYLLATGSPVSNVILLCILFFVLAYSMAGLRFKEIPLLDSLTSSIHFVGPMVFAFSLNGFDAVYIPYIIAFLLWGIASHAFGAVQDIIPDRKGNLSSIATVFGAKLTVRFSFLLYCSTSLILISLGFPAFVVGITGLLYAANLIPYLRITDKKSGESNKAWRRFIWLNLFTGFIITIVLIASYLT